jgi:ferredoxin-NADP reductase
MGRLGRRLAGSSLLEALAAPHGVERYIELVRPSLSLREVRAEIVAVHRATPTSVTLSLRPNELWQGFQAGQFVSLSMQIDGVRRTRCYSPASSQHARGGELELTVRAHPEGLVSRHLREHARPGTVVGLTQADGQFTLPMPRPQHLLLISGGSGITPVMSMLRTLCDEGHSSAVTFLHYARHELDVPYRDELERLAACHPNLRVVYVYTREPRPQSRLHGHIARGQLRAIDARYRQAEVYVCGPPSLIAATRSLWAQDGREEQVHSESFLPPRLHPGLAADAKAMSGRVRFARSDVELNASGGTTLLEQAERAGLAPNYGCRMGICHTCTCRKLAGAVRNINSGEVSSHEEEDIQICVSLPAGDVELDL